MPMPMRRRACACAWYARDMVRNTPFATRAQSVICSATDGDGIYTAVIPWIEPGETYRIRARAVGTYGKSEWRTSAQIVAAGPTVGLPAPPKPAAKAASSSRINITAQQANISAARQLLTYVNSADNPLLATQQAGDSVSVSLAHTGLTTGTTRYYFTRARDQWGNLSVFSASASATTT